MYVSDNLLIQNLSCISALIVTWQLNYFTHTHTHTQTHTHPVTPFALNYLFLNTFWMPLRDLGNVTARQTCTLIYCWSFAHMSAISPWDGWFPYSLRAHSSCTWACFKASLFCFVFQPIWRRSTQNIVFISSLCLCLNLFCHHQQEPEISCQ